MDITKRNQTLTHATDLQALKAQLDAKEAAQKLAIYKAVNQIEKERDALKNEWERAALEKQLAADALKDKYETQIFAFTDGHSIV